MPSRTSSFRLEEMLLAPPPWTTTTRLTSMEARHQEEASVISNRSKRTNLSEQPRQSGFRFLTPCSVRILSEKPKVTHAPQHSSPCFPTPIPGARLGASVAQNAGCQDFEPALVPQRYPSASISLENSSLYFVLGRRYRRRVHQSSSPPPRSPFVPQFPGVCVPCSSSLHLGSGVP